MTSVWCELALIDGRPQRSVLIQIENGRFGSISVGAEPGDALRLSGFTIPGLANAHSHAFQRALRSRTQSGRGTFWTWRDLMYRAAARIEPVTYHRLARAVFAEMAMAGIAVVGEFHYLHHQLDGSPYEDRNEMGHAVLQAARDAGIRITLLDAAYLHGGLGVDGYSAVAGTQRRFSDGTAEAWADRVDGLAATDGALIGAAVHSVRAVDPEAMATIGRYSAEAQVAVHAHLSEQVAENDACLAGHGRTPTDLFQEAGMINQRFTAVHATHLDERGVEMLAAGGATVAMCPTTERDLGDGIGPTDRFATAAVSMSLGTDSHAAIDLLEEARALELHQRLRSQQRGIHSACELLTMATGNGHRSLGWEDAGSITAGNRADLATVTLGSVRTAGTPNAATPNGGTRTDGPRTDGPRTDGLTEAVIFSATAADITDVFVDGRQVVADGHHLTIDAPAELGAAITDLLDS